MSPYTLTVRAGDAVSTGTFNVRVARYVGAVCSPANGCPSSVSDWLNYGQSTFGGQLMANKIFYSGTQSMDSWQSGHLKTDNESQIPAECLTVVTFKDAQIPALTKYITSIPLGREVWMCYWQEAEDSFPNGDFKTFKTNFISAAKTIRAVKHPGVRILQDSAGYHYGQKGSSAQLGQWIVDPEFVDVYSIDTYQNQPD